jgi:hypothetical protein
LRGAGAAAGATTVEADGATVWTGGEQAAITATASRKINRMAGIQPRLRATANRDGSPDARPAIQACFSACLPGRQE